MLGGMNNDDSIDARDGFNRFDKLGYTGPLALTQAVKEWSLMHSYALDVIAHNALYTHGGVECNLAGSYVMMFKIQAVRNRANHVSKAFRILDAGIRHKDDMFPFLMAAFQEDALLARKKQVKGWRELRDLGPRFAGALPMVYIVADTTVVSLCATPVYRPLRHVDGETPDSLHRMVFQDLDRMCMDAIASGIVFDVPEDTKRILPDIGTYVRDGRKGWKEHMDFGMWEEVIDRFVVDKRSRYPSGKSVVVIWALHENW